jgi:hypothetical protein
LVAEIAKLTEQEGNSEFPISQTTAMISDVRDALDQMS